MRRLRGDGSIDYLARWPRELPLELVVETGSLGAGKHETELRIDGVPRARVIATVSPSVGEVALERFESLGDPHHAAFPAFASRPGPHFLLQQVEIETLVDSAPPAVKPVEVDPKEWAKRDMEGKWALYQRWIAPSPALREGWVPFLVEQKDFAFLEWLALYQPDGFTSQGVGRALAGANAPQWARAAHWMRNSSAGHSEQAGRSILRSRPRETLWWLRKYPQAARDLPELVEQFQREKVEPLESPHLLPPLDAKDVFGLLDAPANLSPFGDRLAGESGNVYEQQVVRAIRGYVTFGQPAAEWDGKLRALMRHANVAVRREAYLAFTHAVVGKLDPGPIVTVIDDANEHGTVREAAALAFSYADHPMVYVTLHRIARDVAHPAWPAAVSRLGDLGDGFSLSLFEDLKHPRASQDKILADARERVLARVANEKANMASGQFPPDSAEIVMFKRLARAAWAEAGKDPLAAELLEWAKTETAAQVAAHPTVRNAVARIAGVPGSAPAKAINKPSGSDWEPYAQRVRQLATEIVEGR
jgi:hypothetical protein